MATRTVIEFPTATHELESVVEAAEPTALVALGGLLTIKRFYPLYSKILKLDKTSNLSPRERFVPPPQRGLGTVDGMRSEMNNTLAQLNRRTGTKLDLVGHSLGALMAVMGTLDNPDIIASATLLGGAHEGIKKETLGSRALRQAVGNPPEAKHIRHDSDFMHTLANRVSDEWPEDIPMRIYSTMFDELIRPPHGFGLRPGGRTPAEMGLIVPNTPGVGLLVRHTLGEMPEGVELLRTHYFTEHTNIPRSPVVLGRIAAYRHIAPEALAEIVGPEETLGLPRLSATPA